MRDSLPDAFDPSIEERIRLVEDLCDGIAAESLDSLQLTEAEREELRRRTKAHEEDPSSSIPWEQVRAELLRQFARGRDMRGGPQA